MSVLYLRMDTSKSEMIRYGIGTYESIWHFNVTVYDTLLHYYHSNFVVNSHI